MSLVEGLKPGLNGVLGIRDSIGAALKQVFIVTRTWSGTELGDGAMSETKIQILPSPRVVEFSSDLRIREGGFIQSGDIVLKMISKQTYTSASDLDFSGTAATVEKFYEVGGRLYRPIGVTEKHLTWTVTLRPISDQTR
jgi:hypothetical protein